ncbi:SMI1/KNR4 family protein [Ralstonia pseudosolanacearum]|uniref:SMI1/KNR4 family protein n=1 Tax=Ralstonia pseudosolanacearum TaxID=1310165 RepID=UPI001FFA37FE|nr:SMI1/KNR4 family protein [Ralstonia pseudosolanacearum]
MEEKLVEAIEELKELSGGRVTNVPLPDDELISEYESEVGFLFPEEYKYFLKQASNIFFGTKDPLVVTHDRTDRSELSNAIGEGRKMGIPHDWLPICEDNGDYYCITQNGQIRFWSGNGVANESWQDLATWVKEVWIAEG